MLEPPPRKSRSWWSRNWPWAVPVGCLGLCGLPFACVAGLWTLISTGISHSEPYAEAVDMVRSSDAAVELLGEPIDTGLLTTGEINFSGSSGRADLAIPLHGELRDGTLYVVAEKRAGRWEYELVELQVDGRHERLDLLGGNRAGGD